MNLIIRIEEAKLIGHKGCILALAITSENVHIVSGSWDNSVRIWILQQVSKLLS